MSEECNGLFSELASSALCSVDTRPSGTQAEIFPSFPCPVHFVQSAKKLSNGIFATINLDWAGPGDMKVKGSGVLFSCPAKLASISLCLFRGLALTMSV